MRLGEQRHIYLGQNGKKRLTSFMVCLSLFLFLIMITYAFFVLRPAFARLAEARAREIAIRTINESVVSLFSEEETKNKTAHDDIVSFERGEDGRILAAKSSLSYVSRLKSELTLHIQNSISKIDRSRLKVPLGNLTGNDLFAGVGPDLSFQIKPFGTAECDVLTDFTEMGINQTRLTVTVKVRANMSVLMPTVRKSCQVETSVPVISTVIVGDVPQSYTNIDRDGYTYEEDAMELID